MIDRRTREFVASRAANCCEYCQLPEEYSPVARLQVEHIRPKKHGGDDDVENLALACIDCNLRKGTNLAGIDPQTDRLVELYNPRTQNWPDHFAWSDIIIDSKSDVGRTTIQVLDLNAEDRLMVRLATYRAD